MEKSYFLAESVIRSEVPCMEMYCYSMLCVRWPYLSQETETSRYMQCIDDGDHAECTWQRVPLGARLTQYGGGRHVLSRVLQEVHPRRYVSVRC